MAQDALLSLALPRSSALRPSMQRRLTSLPSAAPSARPVAVADQHDLRLRIVPHRVRADADPVAPADRRQRRRLGEDFRIRPDGDFQILRPQPVGDQRLFQLLRFRRAGLDRADVGADAVAQRRADGLGLARLAPRAFLDHALDGRHREGHACRLDALQIDRRQKPKLARRLFPGAAQIEIAERAEIAPVHWRGAIPAVEKLRHRRRQRGNVPDPAAAHQDGSGAGLGEEAPQKGRPPPILRQMFDHGSSLFARGTASFMRRSRIRPAGTETRPRNCGGASARFVRRDVRGLQTQDAANA